MAELTRYTCPNCNGVLHFAADAQKVTCDFCDSTFDVSELSVADAGDEAKVTLEHSEHAHGMEDFMARAPWSAAEGNLVSHVCSTCGAEIVCDQATVATNCPYCGNVMIASDTLAGRQPQLVIPFTVDRPHAEQIMGRYVVGKWYLPGDFAAELKHIQGVYVPFYLFSGEVEGWARYRGETDHTTGDKDNRHTYTTYSDVYREGEAEFVRVPVDGSSKMPDTHMDAIEPFNYQELTEFNAGYLAGYLAEVSDEDVDECLSRAETRCANTFESKLEHDALRHVDRVSRKDHSTVVDLTRVETTMLPVWLLHSTWENNEMLFAINGQTGRIIGDMPYSRAKRRSTIFVCVLVAGVIDFFLLRSLDTDETWPWILAVVLLIGLPFLVDSHFMSQVRNANIRTEANDAVERGHFEITKRKG